MKRILMLLCAVNERADESSFSGKGAEANNYLLKRAFPKGGSYLLSGIPSLFVFDYLDLFFVRNCWKIL